MRNFGHRVGGADAGENGTFAERLIACGIPVIGSAELTREKNEPEIR